MKDNGGWGGYQDTAKEDFVSAPFLTRNVCVWVWSQRVLMRIQSSSKRRNNAVGVVSGVIGAKPLVDGI